MSEEKPQRAILTLIFEGVPTLEQVKHKYATEILKINNGHLSQTSKDLNIDRKTLWRYLKLTPSST